MKLVFSLALCFLGVHLTAAQPATPSADSVPFRQIPDYPESYTAKAMLVRMIDGLGFRYYWATDQLTTSDLAYKPTEKARTTEETIDHILGLSVVIVNALQQKVNTRSGEETSSLPFGWKRQLTLQNFKTARDQLLTDTDPLDAYGLVFQNGANTTRYPLWNLINGPLEDAIWHVGQVVSFRRSSGNPLNPKVDVLRGKEVN